MSTPASQLPYLPQSLPKTQAEWQQALNVLQTWAQAIQGNNSTITVAGADPSGVNDSTAAINAALSAPAANGGVVILPPGTYICSGTLTLQSGVVLSGYGATINYTGNGTAIGNSSTGALNYAGVRGLIINGGTTAATLLSVASGYNCTFRDLQFLSNSTTNTVISLTGNTTGAANPTGNLNCAQNYFANISQAGNGCGTFISLNGTSSINGLVTDNQFINVQAQTVNVCGINFVQWCDSNIFAGMTRIGLNGTTSPANGIAVLVASAPGQGGVYSELFEQLAIDTFGAPAVDNRQGIVATNPLSPKNMHFWVIEMGPQREANVLNIPQILSGVVNVAPRTSSNYQTTSMLGTNLGLGTSGNTAVTAYSTQGAWLSGASQYVYFAQGSCYNTATALGVSYSATPGAAGGSNPFTVSQIMGFQCATGANGANATVNNSYGYYCADQNYATNNYGFYSNISAGAGKYAFYGGGTAPSLLGGPLGINGNSPPAQVSGWGIPTGAAVQNNFSGSAATLAQTSAAVAKIISDLKAFGIYAA